MTAQNTIAIMGDHQPYRRHRLPHEKRRGFRQYLRYEQKRLVLKNGESFLRPPLRFQAHSGFYFEL
jgi:hypothetical protein